MRTMYLLTFVIVKYFAAFSGSQKTKYLFKLNRTSKYWLHVVAIEMIVDGIGKNNHVTLTEFDDHHTEQFAKTWIETTSKS